MESSYKAPQDYLSPFPQHLRPKYYYGSLLSALVAEQSILPKETSDTGRQYHVLLFTFSSKY